MTDQRADEAIKRQEKLASGRSTWESHWQEIADRVLPRQAEFTVRRTPGEKRTNLIFDSTAPLALERFSAAMEGVLTPRAQRWHHLKASNKKLNDIDEVREWFEQAEDILFGFRYSPGANYASQQHEMYMSLGAFGSGVMFIDQSEFGLRYKSIHLAECFFAEDADGRIDTNYRKFQTTARQAKQRIDSGRWKGPLPRRIEEALKNEPDKPFDFLHCVEPRRERNPESQLARDMPFTSLYVSIEGRQVVHEGGFEEFPYAISRYVTAPRETYGRSPAMTVLADIKMLNEMSKTTIRAGHKAVEPPLLTPDDGVINRFSTRPNAMIHGGVDRQGRVMVHSLQMGGNLPLSLELENQRRAVINDAFLVTLFQILVEQPNQTATEALLRAQEKGVLLSPTMGRQQSEALGPMIAREVAILERNGALPPLPQALVEAEGEYDIEYDSPLSRAQKAEEAVGIVRTLESTLPFAEFQPEVFDNFDGDESVRIIAEANGARRILRGKDDIQQARVARQQQQQAEALQQAVETAPKATKAIKDVVEAEQIAAQ